MKKFCVSLAIMNLLLIGIVVSSTFADKAYEDTVRQKWGKVTVTETSIQAVSGDGNHKLTILATNNGVGLWVTNKAGECASVVSGGSNSGPAVTLIRPGAKAAEWAMIIDGNGVSEQTIGNVGQGEIKHRKIGE